MKNLICLLFVIVSFGVSAQITLTSNPALVSPATTDTQYIDLPRDVPFFTVILIRTPSTNVSTVQLNSYGSTVSSSPAIAADKFIWLTVIDRRFWVDLANSADDIEISW